MEVIILICLLIVIAMLLHDKIVIQKTSKHKAPQENVNAGLPDIMGHSKVEKRQLMPNISSKSQEPAHIPEVNNFDTEINGNRLQKQIPLEELDEIFSPVPIDLEEEEEEWRSEIFNGDDGLAQGVTFDELEAVGMVLREEIEEPFMMAKAAETVHKIQGTELFALLENSTADASRRIAELLDNKLSREADYGSSTKQNDLDGFDIGEFV